MSNPEKRDDRSMSDILASIRKIMAQEPAVAAPPSNARAPLNGVSGPREPELKLPPHPAETAAANPAPATEPVSLDELLAETPHAAAAAGPALKPPPAAKATPASTSPVNGAPEWLFPRQNAPDAAKESVAEPVLPSPAPAKDAAPAASPSPAAKLDGSSAPAKPAAEAATIGPPTPKLGDLGSVVPGKTESGGPQLEAGPQRPATAERTVLGPPLPGPLLGEPPRVPAALEALPEVPGADALRRLIAGVIPPSAHPSVAPAAKAPDAAPGPAADRADDTAKVDATAKAASDAKVETKPAPANPPPAAKKVEAPAPTPTPAPAPAPKPAAAAPATTPAPAPAPKPAAAAPAPAPKPAATPAPAAKSAAPVPAQAIPAPKPAATAPAGVKSMDETVVELLRPLLRDWLNANMPRLIEPALKAELEALRNAAAKDKKD
ncbi:DUF2497 domain-containing protein [Hyphomicrobium sp. CS1BSMeth3]|uniref:DUF2497 domain-containing protein n=1 Tax=Hyphomicrobium sp. CS1BSMeth3 TaxID=1892844 RepID=UPI00093016C3|nr:DUF2497 domain-containing protein [Hyphomicrobium sp. CS1BSMeth3]